MHELEKLDAYLGLEIGISYSTLICHNDPAKLNAKLIDFGIELENYGILNKSQRYQWKELMIKAGISKKYWKDPELLNDDVNIEDL